LCSFNLATRLSANDAKQMMQKKVTLYCVPLANAVFRISCSSYASISMSSPEIFLNESRSSLSAAVSSAAGGTAGCQHTQNTRCPQPPVGQQAANIHRTHGVLSRRWDSRLPTYTEHTVSSAAGGTAGCQHTHSTYIEHKTLHTGYLTFPVFFFFFFSGMYH